MTEDALVADLLKRFPQASLRDLDPGSRELCFPHLVGNDSWYHATFGSVLQLGAWIAPYGEPQPSFWYMPFDLDAYATDLERLTHFREAAFDVLLHRTRITQVRGLLFSTFLCEACQDGTWKRVYRNGYLRLTIRDVPRIAGRRHTYSAGELLSPAPVGIKGGTTSRRSSA